MSNKAIVLDANILVRAVLGRRVRELIIEHTASVKFIAQWKDLPRADRQVDACTGENGQEPLAPTVLGLLQCEPRLDGQ